MPLSNQRSVGTLGGAQISHVWLTRGPGYIVRRVIKGGILDTSAIPGIFVPVRRRGHRFKCHDIGRVGRRLRVHQHTRLGEGMLDRRKHEQKAENWLSSHVRKPFCH